MSRQVRALIDDAVVPVEFEPLESLEDRASALVGAPRLVGVLDAEQKLTAELPRVKPVEERGARAPDVQISGGRWGAAKARCGAGGHDEIGKEKRVHTGRADPPSGERGIRT